MRSIHLDMIRVTEAAAIAASKWIGRGDKIAADKAAVDAMRDRLDIMKFAGLVVIGEGKKDGAPGLFDGDWVGAFRDRHIMASSSVGDTIEFVNREPYVELAVDPIEGTTPTAKGGTEAISVLAVSQEKCLFQTANYYMRKIAAGPQVKQKVDLSIDDPLNKTIRTLSYALDKDIPNITVCVLDRPRHDTIVKEIRHIGCKIKLIQDCDVTGAVATGLPDTGIDLFVGIGGAPEGVITACAMKCIGGMFQAKLVTPDWKDEGEILQIEDLAKGDVIFCATGITDGILLKGVRYVNNKPSTNSILMRSESNTIRKIEGIHGN